MMILIMSKNLGAALSPLMSTRVLPQAWMRPGFSVMGYLSARPWDATLLLELKEAANKFAVTEMLQRRQFSVQERDREILSHEGPQVKRLERIKKHNITNKQTPFILHLLTQ